MKTRLSPVSELKQIFSESLLNNTSKVNKVSDESIVNGVAFGVAKRNTGDVIYTPFNYALNTTYLIVVKYTFNPTTIDDDFAVYVDDIKNPSKILGYRDGGNWYNADGAEIGDPEILKTGTGIAPLLVDKEKTNNGKAKSKAYRKRNLLIPIRL